MYPTYIHSKEGVEEAMAVTAKRIASTFNFDQYICELIWRPKSTTRSLPQNALFHSMVAEITEFINSKGHSYTNEQMKELLKYKFLGTESIVAWDGTVIEGQIRKTSNLSTGEMSHFIDEVLDWALGIGVRPKNPADGEYMQLKRQQVS
jgi:hypothetical protein